MTRPLKKDSQSHRLIAYRNGSELPCSVGKFSFRVTFYTPWAKNMCFVNFDLVFEEYEGALGVQKLEFATAHGVWSVVPCIDCPKKVRSYLHVVYTEEVLPFAHSSNVMFPADVGIFAMSGARTSLSTLVISGLNRMLSERVWKPSFLYKGTPSTVDSR